jgi:hypothetical protein
MDFTLGISVIVDPSGVLIVEVTVTVCTKSVSVVREMIVEVISEVNRFVLVALLDKVRVCVTEDVVYPR